MAYLTGPRLNFTGKFVADVSTVNNHPANYDGTNYTAADYANWDIGYWNPYGTGVWRLIDCAVTGAVRGDGTAVTADPVLSMALADADDQPPAKMVDLDSEQQMVSAIWGLVVRLVGGDGQAALRSDFAVASFTDLWKRSLTPGSLPQHTLHPACMFGAAWQSVLSGLAWGDVAGSPFLQELQAAATDGLLSIKFNVVGYNAGYWIGDDGTRYPPLPDFAMGLITGSIGVAGKDEPRFFTLGRKLQPSQPQSRSAPTLFYYATAVVDEARKALTIDLGNSIPFKEWRGDIVGETLQVGYLDSARTFQTLGEVVPDNAWYQRTAGIAGIALTDAQLTAVAASPLAVRRAGAGTLLGQEPADGKALRADQFVFRMVPGDSAETTVWATAFGKPLANAAVALAFDNSSLGGDGEPPVGTPPGALSFPPSVETDAAGKATVPFSAGDPGYPRAVDDIDGQVYGVRPTLDGSGAGSYGNPWDFISFLVWSGYAIPDEPSWEADIRPILAQYAALYPVMLPVLDMGDYDSVCKHLYSLQYALSLPEENPNYMPAVRDLSPNKKAAILKWAANPVRGTAPAKGSANGPAAPAAVASAAPAPEPAFVQASPAAETAPHPATYLRK
ncbi:hypothetical protein EI613_30870 [Azospirillum sp. 412522]|nr:hypothetical protein [Azospirillum sp. 412522]MBY6266276.1 hypothetical protein [Azospirillum sp. 412522]